MEKGDLDHLQPICRLIDSPISLAYTIGSNLDPLPSTSRFLAPSFHSEAILTLYERLTEKSRRRSDYSQFTQEPYESLVSCSDKVLNIFSFIVMEALS